MIRRLLLPGLFACLVMLQAVAETAYVTDRLRLGVHAAPDTSDRAFVSLNSGEAVEVLERSRSFVRVRLPDGREGWVVAAYLLDEEPAVLQLAQLTAERDQLAAELNARQGNSADQAVAMKQLRDEAREARSQEATVRAELAELRQATDELRAQAARSRFSAPLGWLVIATIGACLLGALIAWRWFDRRSRSRHGGFRIY
ncbi:MAG: TIGR04211 family SH3 domain-containing protein [Gammaproteobacteria bacterium]